MVIAYYCVFEFFRKCFMHDGELLWRGIRTIFYVHRELTVLKLYEIASKTQLDDLTRGSKNWSGIIANQLARMCKNSWVHMGTYGYGHGHNPMFWIHCQSAHVARHTRVPRCDLHPFNSARNPLATLYALCHSRRGN